MLTVNTNCSTETVTGSEKLNYLYHSGDYTTMNDELLNINWDSEFEGRNVNENWELLKKGD